MQSKKAGLRDITRSLYNERPKTVKAEEVAEHLGVSVSWLNTFARGEIENPGVMTIEALKAYLENKTKGVKS